MVVQSLCLLLQCRADTSFEKTVGDVTISDSTGVSYTKVLMWPQRKKSR